MTAAAARSQTTPSTRRIVRMTSGLGEASPREPYRDAHAAFEKSTSGISATEALDASQLLVVLLLMAGPLRAFVPLPASMFTRSGTRVRTSRREPGCAPENACRARGVEGGCPHAALRPPDAHRRRVSRSFAGVRLRIDDRDAASVAVERLRSAPREPDPARSDLGPRHLCDVGHTEPRGPAGSERRQRGGSGRRPQRAPKAARRRVAVRLLPSWARHVERSCFLRGAERPAGPRRVARLGLPGELRAGLRRIDGRSEPPRSRERCPASNPRGRAPPWWRSSTSMATVATSSS
jgi:hypothetical protein